MIVRAGQTDVTTYFVLRDSTAHAPITTPITGTDQAADTATGIDLYYVVDGAAISSKVDAVSLGAADAAHADNKVFHVGQGLYRIDWPDAAFAGAAGTRVHLIVVCSGVDTTFYEQELSPAADVRQLNGIATDDSQPVGSRAVLYLDRLDLHNNDLTFGPLHIKNDSPIGYGIYISGQYYDIILAGAGTINNALGTLLSHTIVAGMTMGTSSTNLGADIANILEDTGTTLPASIAALAASVGGLPVLASIVNALLAGTKNPIVTNASGQVETSNPATTVSITTKETVIHTES